MLSVGVDIVPLKLGRGLVELDSMPFTLANDLVLGPIGLSSGKSAESVESSVDCG